MTLTGTVSDFDEAGLFGLIVADDGSLLLFNLRDAPAALQCRIDVGVRVTFAKHASEPTARAVEVVPMAASNDNGALSAGAER
jgi:hypothetical protein